MRFKSMLLAAGLFSAWLPSPSAQAQGFDITTSNYPAGAGASSGGGNNESLGKTITLIATPNAAAKTVFLNWTVGGAVVSTNSHYPLVVTESELVVANFGYTVTTRSSPAPGGTLTGAGDYTNGASVTITAAPGDCYDFVSWTKTGRVGDISTNTSYNFTIGASESFVANFKLKEDVITTASMPAKGGTTSGGRTYGCGAEVSVTATHADGYKFNGWMAGGIPVSLNNPYSFKAGGSEELTADFLDVSEPTVAFTSPTASEKTGATLLQISGTAKNVLGVSSVVLTVGGNPATVNTTNNWTNWWATALLSPGSNLISVYALSEADNPSITKSITVTDTNAGFAPSALSGLAAQVVLNGASSLQLSFGAATFEQFGTNPGQGCAVGNYTYTQTGQDTAVLALVNFAPPNAANGGNAGIDLLFSSPTNATLTDTNGDTGTFALSAPGGLDVSSQSGWTISSVDTTSNRTTTTFGDGTFTSPDSNGTNTAGEYECMQYAPMSVMIARTNVDAYVGGEETNFYFALFTTRSNGNFFQLRFDGAGDAPTLASGTFTGAYEATGMKYIAPASLNGISSMVTQTKPQVEPAFRVTFGQATMAQTTDSTNNKSTVSNYVYTRTGVKTGILKMIQYLPPSQGDDGGVNIAYLTFTSPTSLTYINPTGGNNNQASGGTITGSVLPQSDYFAPISLPVARISPAGGNPGMFNLGAFSSGGGSTGTYTYSQFSPTVGMLVISETGGSNAGETQYVQLTFSSATGGSSPGDFFDYTGDGSIKVGTFTFAK